MDKESEINVLPKPDKIEDSVLVTHMGCMDGSACAIFFIAAGGNKDNIRFVVAGGVERFIKEEMDSFGDRFVIFADVGLTQPKYADILEKRGNVVILDHHKTSLHMKDRSWCLIDAEGNGGSCCGAELLRKYLCSLDKDIDYKLDKKDTDDLGDYNVYRAFAKIVDDHDRWIRNIPVSEKLANLMSFIGQKRFIERFSDLNNGRITWGELKFESFESELLVLLEEKKHESIDQAMKFAVVKDFMLSDGSVTKAVYLVNSEPNVSLLLNVALKRFPEAKFSVQINVDKNSVSLRSNGEVDVSEVAKMFGGGGHQRASGHRLNNTLAKEILELVHG